MILSKIYERSVRMSPLVPIPQGKSSMIPINPFSELTLSVNRQKSRVSLSEGRDVSWVPDTQGNDSDKRRIQSEN